jgi:hypothetical protein
VPITDEQIGAVIADLLRSRHPPATICPSEAARALSPGAWRPLMPRIRDVAIAMARIGALEIRQRGRTVPPGEEIRGPIRLAAATAAIRG